ncbi:DUF4307 domain-containing protein [Corynebacterium hindlerae]|uniref:DUF4307 domain-containing protein n=1 Tax=Corynebacterium hindlerae TaxID=699041 RepID=A0A7G5FGG9_9CORY|nr:DUF4307 domain-containing protein [Corynebacterium hindlerae]QMV85710.1 DUF4307 domain-containing protein [Corynebacterium hindlerae]QTH60627.1 DUF4307 domain-containing protein [Corynebacterium hindlerae]
MTSSATPTASYGPKETEKRGVVGPIIAIGAVLFVIALGVVVFQYFQKINAVTVSATTAGFEQVDDKTLRVNVDVSRDDVSVPSYCIVTSMNYDKAEVGRREFIISPGGEKTQRMQVDIPSRDIPVAAKVYGCSDKLPAHLAQ